MNKKTLIISALVWCSLMVPALLLASGCIELGCTQAGCDSEATVVIHGIEADQSYEVELEAGDGSMVKCTIDDSLEWGIECSGNSWFYYRELDRAGISMLGTPDRIEVTVRQSETVLHQEEVEPSYGEFAPNGELCGPVCRQAEVNVAL